MLEFLSQIKVQAKDHRHHPNHYEGGERGGVTCICEPSVTIYCRSTLTTHKYINTEYTGTLAQSTLVHWFIAISHNILALHSADTQVQ